MKKKLEADLMSLAHRVLRLKGKEDINQMLLETQKLYEKLAILKFVEENFEPSKPTLSMPEIENLLEKELTLEPNQTTDYEQEISITPLAETNVRANETQQIPDSILSFEIEEEISTLTEENIIQSVENLEEVTEKKEQNFEPEIKKEFTKAPTQITLEYLLAPEFRETEFVKKTDLNNGFSNKGTSLNDRLNKTITLGLNDRIAFEKQLFNGSATDLNRVISQLNTFESLQEATNFIETMIKPDYNYWKDKEMYEERLMELITKKFS